MEERKKIKIGSELAYILGILTLSFAVAMMSAAKLGLSMVVSPAYILSLKLTALSFGQCEYILQGLLFIAFCIIMRQVKLLYFCSFLTGLIYGAVLDLWRLIIPAFNPSITAPGSFPLALRILFFALGLVMTSFSVALFFKTYLYPMVYDFFVKSVSAKYGANRTKFKRVYDLCSFLVALAMTLLFFKRIVGIGWGTLVMTVANSFLIGFFDRLMTRRIDFVPAWPRLAEKFRVE